MAISRTSWARARIPQYLAVAATAAILVGGCAAAAGASVPAATGSPDSSIGSPAAGGTVSSPAVGAPIAVSGGGASGVASTGSATSGQAIAYPYPGYPGTPGLAPDNTIVVTGFGQAPTAADGSDRATAQQAALKAALSDAKAQADTVAHATGVAIQGVLSVSVSSSQGFCCPVPMVVGAPGGGATGPGVSTPAQPQIAPAPELDATVTVAYRIG